MRWRSALMAAAFAAATAVPAQADDADQAQQRQRTIIAVLTTDSLNGVQRIRVSCATGRQPQSISERRAAGFVWLPDAADYCVTALTRLGRDGVLGYVQDAASPALRPALAFDQGFVTGYRRHEPVAANLPAMATLKPIAERCLAQAEANTDLCNAAGYAFGTRAAQGEQITIR